MPDGTYAKIPADYTEPPPPPPPPPGDWVERSEFNQEVAERRAADQHLQQQIDELREQGAPIEELEELEQRVAGLEEAVPAIDDLEGRVSDLEAATPVIGGRLTDIEERLDQISSDTTLLDRIRILEGKKLLIPMREITPGPVVATTYHLSYSGGGTIEPGPITVLTADGSRPAFWNKEEITATVDAQGRVTFNRIPGQQVALIFGIEVSFEELPREAFREHFVTELERDVKLVLDIERIDRDLELEKITPSGLIAASVGDTVYLSWSYTDTPELSHFIVEYRDPVTGQWIPYDGGSGVVMK